MFLNLFKKLLNRKLINNFKKVFTEQIGVYVYKTKNGRRLKQSKW